MCTHVGSGYGAILLPHHTFSLKCTYKIKQSITLIEQSYTVTCLKVVSSCLIKIYTI